jgi:hypothetical protein
LLLAQTRITISILFYIGGFLITWTPYTIVFLYNCFKNINDESQPILSTISAVFAKSSVFWSTLFYILTNRNIKSKLLKKKPSDDSIAVQYSRQESFKTSKNSKNSKNDSMVFLYNEFKKSQKNENMEEN